MDLRAGHPRVQDVADDGDLQGVKCALVAANGEHVQHGLGGVGMASVTGIDHADMGRNVFGDKMGGTAIGVTYHE